MDNVVIDMRTIMIMLLALFTFWLLCYEYGYYLYRITKSLFMVTLTSITSSLYYHLSYLNET